MTSDEKTLAGLANLSTPSSEMPSRSSRGWQTRARQLLTPAYLRHGQLPERRLWMYLLLAVQAGLGGANLNYSVSILVRLSQYFNVTESHISLAPTVVNAGVATGIFLVCPLGDIHPKRTLLLVIPLLAAAINLGIALSRNAQTFIALTFFGGFFGSTFQTCIALACEIAPPNHRAGAIGVVMAGLFLGNVSGRLLFGVIAQHGSWRATYFGAAALNLIITIVTYFTLPLYAGLPTQQAQHQKYWRLVWGTLQLPFLEPVVATRIVACFFVSASFANFWATLAFLLSDAPYEYNTEQIGLFALITLTGAVLCLVGGSIARKTSLWTMNTATFCIIILAQTVYTVWAKTNLSAVIVSGMLLDVTELWHLANNTALLTLDSVLMSRFNALNALLAYSGQMTWDSSTETLYLQSLNSSNSGAQAGAQIFLQYGSHASGVFSIASLLASTVVFMARGPLEKRYTWIGWKEGCSFAKPERERDSAPVRDVETDTPKSTAGGPLEVFAL